MENYYAHTIKITNFKIQDLYIIDSILKSGFILSRRKIKELGVKAYSKNMDTILYNGLDYISLCDLNKNHNGYSAYNMYTRQGLSLLIDHDINVITPEFIDKNSYDYYNIDDFDVVNHRFSDMRDEVQVKDSISLEHLRGICLATSTFLVSNNREYLDYYLKYLQAIIDNYGYNIPIYNLDTGEKMKIKNNK